MLVPIILIILFSILIVPNLDYFKQAKASGSVSDKPPDVFSPNMKVEQIFQKHLGKPPSTLTPVSSTSFLGIEDILLLNKNNGTVHRILNGSFFEEPLLDVKVANNRERGLLGIASSTYSIPNDDRHAVLKYIFLYYTEANKDGNDVCPKKYI